MTHLQNETDLTRKTIIDILIKSNTLDRFKLNPQIYIQEAGNIINSVKERFKMRPSESKKIDCGIKHFKALQEDVKFVVARKLDDVLDRK